MNVADSGFEIKGKPLPTLVHTHLNRDQLVHLRIIKWRPCGVCLHTDSSCLVTWISLDYWHARRLCTRRIVETVRSNSNRKPVEGLYFSNRIGHVVQGAADRTKQVTAF